MIGDDAALLLGRRASASNYIVNHLPLPYCAWPAWPALRFARAVEWTLRIGQGKDNGEALLTTGQWPVRCRPAIVAGAPTDRRV